MWKVIGSLNLVAIALSTNLLQAADYSRERDHFDPLSRVVLPPEEALRMAASSFPGKKLEAWSPADKDLKLLEDTLERRLRAAGKLSEKVLQPGYYHRQYGAVALRGHRFIVVNGFVMSAEGRERDYWRHAEVSAFDGGCAHIHALYDVDKHHFGLVSCNGNA